MTTRVWLYHPEKAPNGHLYESMDETLAKQLADEGWLDDPQKFPGGRANAPAQNAPLTGQGGASTGGGTGSQAGTGSTDDEAAKKKAAEEAEQKRVADAAAAALKEKGLDKPVDQHTDDELKAMLTKWEVSFRENASRDKLLAAVNAYLSV